MPLTGPKHLHYLQDHHGNGTPCSRTCALSRPCIPGVHQPWEAISEFSLSKSQNRPWDTGENMVSTARQTGRSHTCRPHGARGPTSQNFWGVVLDAKLSNIWLFPESPILRSGNSLLFTPGLSCVQVWPQSSLRGKDSLCYPLPLSGPWWAGTAAVTWECWHGPIPRALSSPSGIYLSSQGETEASASVTEILTCWISLSKSL